MIIVGTSTVEEKFETTPEDGSSTETTETTGVTNTTDTTDTTDTTEWVVTGTASTYSDTASEDTSVSMGSAIQTDTNINSPGNTVKGRVPTALLSPPPVLPLIK